MWWVCNTFRVLWWVFVWLAATLCVGSKSSAKHLVLTAKVPHESWSFWDHIIIRFTRSIWKIPAWEKGWFFHYEHSHFGSIPSFGRGFLHFSHTQEGIVPRGNVVNAPCDSFWILEAKASKGRKWRLESQRGCLPHIWNGVMYWVIV